MNIYPINCWKTASANQSAQDERRTRRNMKRSTIFVDSVKQNGQWVHLLKLSHNRWVNIYIDLTCEKKTSKNKFSLFQKFDSKQSNTFTSTKYEDLHFKWAIPGLFFVIFVYLMQLTVNQYSFRTRLNSTTLSTEAQPLPLVVVSLSHV